MVKSVVIVGAGISGLTTGWLLHKLDPAIELSFFDAGPEPQLVEAGVDTAKHYGATLGQGRDARHFTGTEGLSFQNPIHTKLLFEKASSDGQGWQAIPETELTKREQNWREECLERYSKHVTPEHNPYDVMYTTLNYGGIAAWDVLTTLDPEIAKFKISADSVYVVFKSDHELQLDLTTEMLFNPWQTSDPVTLCSLAQLNTHFQKVLAVDKICSQMLRVPGETWRIKALWRYMYKELSVKATVRFHWDKAIASQASLPNADAYVWAAGSIYAMPDFYTENSRVQGVGGWWMTLSNPGFTVPFKFSAPQPSGYINFTPDGEDLHISGGFGWVGERDYEEAERLLQPAKKQLIVALSNFLTLSIDKLRQSNFGCCIRPTTPTGLPDVRTHVLNNKMHLTISGGGKAGATQASLLGMHVASQLGLEKQLALVVANHSNAIMRKTIREGLRLLQNGFEPSQASV